MEVKQTGKDKAPLDEEQVVDFARSWFERLLAGKFEGRVYLAGGAFKTVLHSRPPNDIDLFPVTEEGRAALLAVLRDNGAVVVADNEPYQTVLDFRGQRVEVAYSSHYSTLTERLDRFDLALSAIGVEYDNGRLHAEIHRLAIASVERREIVLIRPLRNWKYALATLERMERYADELGFAIPGSERRHIWETFEARDPEMQRGMLERFRKVGRNTKTIVEEAQCRLH